MTSTSVALLLATARQLVIPVSYNARARTLFNKEICERKSPSSCFVLDGNKHILPALNQVIHAEHRTPNETEIVGVKFRNSTNQAAGKMQLPYLQ